MESLAGRSRGESVRTPAAQFMRDHPMRPDEVTMKEYLADMAAKAHLSNAGAWYRLKKHNWPGVQLRRINRRVVYVRKNYE